MITICPQCQLPLAVTATDLRIAQGQVRCGRCAAVFNALASLYEPGSAPAAASTPAAPAPTPAAPATTAATPAAARVAAETAPAPAAAESAASAPAAAAPAAAATATATATSVTTPAATPDKSIATPATAPSSASPPLSGSGLFRTLPRDDEPRFDDTHGADDWPEEFAAQAPQPEVTPQPPAPAPTAPSASLSATGTDTGLLQRAATPSAPLPEDVGLDGMQAQRDWQADTMTAADLAALMARDGTSEPPEFASIEIAVDDSSEITVLPSETVAVMPAVPDEAAPPPAALVVAPPQAAAPPLAMSPPPAAPAADRGGATFPRLQQVPDDDPDLAGARLEAAGRRAALDAGSAPLRWLELEPAVPAPNVTATTPPSADGPRASLLPTPVDFVVAPPDSGAPPAAPATLPNPAPTASWDGAGADAADRSTVGPLARSLGLDADLAPIAAPGTDAPPADDAAAAEIAAGAAPRAVAAPRWMWAATPLLALALGAQLVHVYREQLVAVPALREPLMALYASLGRPLQPRWDLGGYELRQQGVVAEPVAAGTLTVRASIRNGALQAQPAPLLRVTLQDRFGNRIATRDLTPREYGGAAAIAPAPMLAPGQRIDAEVSLLDPGGEAVGFELDVCLRRADAAVVCANDAPTAHG